MWAAPSRCLAYVNTGTHGGIDCLAVKQHVSASSQTSHYIIDARRLDSKRLGYLSASEPGQEAPRDGADLSS